MYNDVIWLISTVTETNAMGDPVQTEVAREVFAQERSVGMKESYAAFAVGLKPEKTFVIADCYDYQGEQIVEHAGERYRVLRTYRKDTFELEITVTR